MICGFCTTTVFLVAFPASAEVRTAVFTDGRTKLFVDVFAEERTIVFVVFAKLRADVLAVFAVFAAFAGFSGSMLEVNVLGNPSRAKRPITSFL